jgi:hypothetical protein
MKTTSLLVAVATLLGACAVPNDAPRTPASTGTAAPEPPASKTGNQLTQAATTPLADFNLVKADIPSVLQSAQKSPYAMPPDRTCQSLSTEVQALDAALGADLDTPATASNPSLIERGGGAVGNAAVGAFRGAAEGVVPFRGWVRKLSGAERYSREVAAAIAAGTIRRAFLKGVGQASGCPAPAAPRS